MLPNVPTNGVWRSIVSPDEAASTKLPRSAQVAAVVKDDLFTFFGELQPRTPVPNEVYRIPLDGAIEAANLKGHGTTSAPSPRVGTAAASIGDKIYVFGGRGGKEMTALEEAGAVHVFDTMGQAWTTLQPSSETHPDARSFHAACAVAEPELGPNDGTFYMHAGCLSSGGRSSELWSFTPATREWLQLASAPGVGRGGTALTASLKGDKLYRFGGFDGKNEIGYELDVYDVPTNEWDTLTDGKTQGGGPSPRSVAGMVAVLHKDRELLVLVNGEGDASNLGHDGAGKFHNDVWIFDTLSASWETISILSPGPIARGWFGIGVSSKQEVVISGGLNDKNERLGDVWALRLHIQPSLEGDQST